MSLTSEKKSGKESIVPRLLLVGLLAIGSFLRLYGLGDASYWVDEVNHVYAGTSLLKGESPAFPSGEPNLRSLLFSRTVAISFRLFGVSEFSARLPSAIFGILAIVAIYYVARRWFGPWVGVLSAFLLAFSHLGIGWARTCRMYTLFQLLYLVVAFWFYNGYEPDEEPTGLRSGIGWLRRGQEYFNALGIRPGPVLLSGVVLLIAYFVHMLAGLFAASVALYAVAFLLVTSMTHGLRAALGSKYALLLGIGAVGATLGVIFLGLDKLVSFALSFRPMWADYGSVQDSHFFYYFLTDSFQFPWAAFFLLGSIQMLTRANKRAFYVFVNFIVPLFLLSFVFAYRVPNYIVHVYPFYVMIIAYGLRNLIDVEEPRLRSALKFLGARARSWVPRIALVVVFFGWVPLSLWFRYAVKLPFIGSSGKNGAVNHVAWREAVDYVKHNEGPADVVISTLPLTVHYYLGSVDYNLNMINLDQTLNWSDKEKVHDYDFYSGAPAIRSVDELRRVIESHPGGFLILDVYRLERGQYVPRDIAGYITTKLRLAWEDSGGTVRVYRWRNHSTS